LRASYFAIDSGKTILIANKESIVAAGDVLMPLAKARNSKIIPIDSEHNAIHQCMPPQRNLKEISKIMITASGGPFRKKTFKELSGVVLQDAVKHPTWSMGTKITINSATLVNKCLELIEAHYLFQIPESQIEIVVHPQSIIHSMVTFIDGSTIAQMSNPNMVVPIANALGVDQRLPINFEAIDFPGLNLSFEPIADGREAIFEMAREVCNNKGNLGVIFNTSAVVSLSTGCPGRLVSGAHDGTIRVWDLDVKPPPKVANIKAVRRDARYAVLGHTIWLGGTYADAERIICDGANNVLLEYDFSNAPQDV
jgi:1-deoxy-D-xylulose-5-phosphate reductoisomerase